jgi:antirestriction protein ArdC
MDWYVVIKTINGRRYYYRQKTWREGKRVRTLSHYIGPVAGEGSSQTNKERSAAFGATIDVEGSVAVLMGERSKNWQHHWEGNRDGDDLVEKDERVERLLKSLEVQWTHNTTGAYYRPSADEVNIPPERCFMDKSGQSATAAYYVVLFHELIHWTARRVQRKHGFDGLAYAREELVAELGAVTLMRSFGIDLGYPQRHAKYFQVWLSRAGSQKAAMAHAKKEAERAVRFVVEHGKVTS